MKTAKDMTGMGFEPLTQFELTQKLINNLQQFNITPTAKLVLLYLSSCYNPKKVDIYPKQKTISLNLGISERTVVRAIAELLKEGLIVIECKYQNRYRFTNKIVKNFKLENMSFAKGQKGSKQGDNLAQHEPINLEQLKEQTEEKKLANKVSLADFEKLKQYATSKGAKNPVAYANKIIQNGNVEEILKQLAEPERIKENAQRRIAETKQLADSIADRSLSAPPPEEVKQKAAALIERIRSKNPKNCTQ